MTERYVAVIFTNRHTGVDPDEYEAEAARMIALAQQQQGSLGVESVRGVDGIGITVSYWETEADARAWKAHSEHLVAQAAGRERWYAWYRVRVATVEREYAFFRDEPDAILHIAMPTDWAAARADGRYRMSTRGRTLEQEGFVHCSYPHQLEAVANRFYGDVTELVLLHIDPELLAADLRVEPAESNELFPHVYGPIPMSAVVATTRWERDAGDVWRRPA